MPVKRMLMSTRSKAPKFLAIPPSGSSRSFKEFLLHSPLPSPALPALVPRHGKKPPPLNTRKTLRVLFWLAVFTLVCILFSRSRPGPAKNPVGSTVYRSKNGQEYEMAEDGRLPDFPSPIAINDKEGESKWTIYIPPHLGFPLPQKTYADICSHVDEVSNHVARLQNNLADTQTLGFYQQDPNFMDVAQAQISDLLPIDSSRSPATNLPICKSSLVYVLDASEAGLGGTLLKLWLAYGLAQYERRAFFIDDSHFAYGRYKSLFSSPPMPNCRPPPMPQRVPCPHLSQHLVVTASTWEWTFGDAFRKQFNGKQIYELTRAGYEALFKLVEDDDRYLQARVPDLSTKAHEDKLIGGIHIRRGDRHPTEFQYQHGYIPPSLYMDAVKEMIKTATGSDPTVLLASDDPDIYHHPGLRGAVRAQERISLASNKQMSDGEVGWEGGFFTNAFWGVGVPEHAKKRPTNPNSPRPTMSKEGDDVGSKPAAGVEYRDYRSNPNEEAAQLRALVGRAYLLDLAVLAKSDRVVCAISSRGCRILGLMMGWDAIEQGHWKNIDGKFNWQFDDV